MRRVDEHAVDVEDRPCQSRHSFLLLGRSPLLLRTGWLLKLERALLAGAKLADLVADAELDGLSGALRVGGERQRPVIERDGERRALELHREGQPVELCGQSRIEVQDSVADLRARGEALYGVERPGHDTHVNTLLGGAALDVADVALERDEESLP